MKKFLNTFTGNIKNKLNASGLVTDRQTAQTHESHDKIAGYYANLSDREQGLIKLLGAVMFCILVMWFYNLHSKAQTLAEQAQLKQQQLSWLKNQAGNVSVQNSQPSTNSVTVIENLAGMQNIRVNIQKQKPLTFTAAHENAIVLGSFFEQLQQKGITFTTLTIKQADDYSVNAYVTAQ